MERKKAALGLFSLCVLMAVFNACASRGTKIAKSARSMVKATIVIDAGHGGDDGGAVGDMGLKEKDLTLDIALRVKRLIARVMPNVRVVLTREHDNFVGLERRISIAHEMRGDVFLSIHINSSDNKDASGFEVYSLDVASERHQDRLAVREHKEPGTKGDVNYILADLRANDNRAESDRLAASISQGLSAQLSKKVSKNSINDRGYNQAIFQVLFVKMPAVLTELFFISNPKEERMLKNEAIRELCARGLVNGLNNYLK
ncbi:MAG TPA: N-acetylmuramoyl-L-alanine amidase, partial [Myxococcota bacterium]|nr:N-acetylmuramoyl-L-alanine amidase [Myxococcota bacterium]